MKKIILSISFSLVAALAFSQSSRYQSSMEKSKMMLDSAKTSEQYTEVAASFERIADAEKKEWLPYYYAALANVLKGYTDQAADKDALADKADKLIITADELQPRNSEIYLLKAMSATLHMIVDPMNRWQKYGGMQKEAIENAKQYNPQNPRIYYFEGQSLFGTPEQFGGGKEKAKPLFEKALKLFDTQKVESTIHPDWGKSTTQRMLEMCK